MKIHLQGCNNCRDLGGIVTPFGTIPQKRLLRSSHLNKITATDVQILLQNDLERIVDLRTALEQQNVPDVLIDEVSYLTVPIMGATTFGITYEKSSGEEIGVMLEAGIKRMTDRGEQPELHMEILYKKFVNDQVSLDGYRNFLKLLANNPVKGATLWHCSAGKDRVGTCTALLLHCLGASDEQIIADYLLTNEQNKPFIEMVMSKISNTLTEKQIQLILGMLSVKVSYLQSFWQEITQKYSNVDNFLSACGVTEQEVQNLRKNYLE